jgi:hypothetical protein
MSAAGLALVGEARATINGEPADDPQEPLVAGDLVAISAARAWRG